MNNKNGREGRIVSEEVYDQINSRPPWIVRNGLGSIFLLIVLATACAGLIKYPETVPLTVKLVASINPVRLEIPDSLSPKVLIPSGHQVVRWEQVAVTRRLLSTAADTLRSTINGKLYVGYDYTRSSTILQITPDSTTYGVWGEIAVNDAQKVAVGMIVRVRLPSNSIAATYLQGRISGISALAIDHKIAVRISPDGPSGEFIEKFPSHDSGPSCNGDLEISNASILGRVFVQFFHLKRIKG